MKKTNTTTSLSDINRTYNATAQTVTSGASAKTSDNTAISNAAFTLSGISASV